MTMNAEQTVVHFRPASDADVPALLALRHRTMAPTFNPSVLHIRSRIIWLALSCALTARS